MLKELEQWLISIHRNKHWWIDPGGRWMDGEGRCVKDRGPATEKEINVYNRLKSEVNA